MRSIEVFYHYFIPPDGRARYMSWWLDSQLSKIRDSGLSNYAKVNMCISMPIDWSFDESTLFCRNLTGEIVTYKEKTLEYIENRYPFVNVLEVEKNYGTEYINRYEMFTLQHMHKRCKEKNIYCLYLHNKGATSNSYVVSNWREIIEQSMIMDWKECIKYIEDDDIDIVAVRDLYSHVPGSNYYWTKSDHISKLLDPVDSSKYLNESLSHMWPGTPGYRYSAENWPIGNNARIHWIKEVNCPKNYNFYEFPQKKDIL